MNISNFFSKFSPKNFFSNLLSSVLWSKVRQNEVDCFFIVTTFKAKKFFFWHQRNNIININGQRHDFSFAKSPFLQLGHGIQWKPLNVITD